MHHVPGVADTTSTAGGPLWSVAALVFAVLAVFHAWHAWRAWRSVRTARVDGNRIAVLTETGHLLVAAGMAYMFSPPAWQARTDRILTGATLAWGYLLLSSVFLTVNVIRRDDPERFRQPGPGGHHDAGVTGTCCCALLAVEGLAMAYMNALRWWSADDLTIGFSLLFTALAVLTAVTLVLRLTARPYPAETRPYPAGGPAGQLTAPFVSRARGASVRVHGCRLIMSAGMVAMFATIPTP
ncbi:hypothetical protein FsymDg_0697 [Candidatus Protofrankia datiscae]|uniref:Uncharacterized protein n=1 Tax=Candidatus Protofrankia datiscae TaxID=2716812 RepID=F8B1Q2_9ACTN|nr:hypothetical protein FsymDg_0697 [Candidatus Protofrankia datiscae]